MSETMTFDEAKALQASIEASVARAGAWLDHLRGDHRTVLGLTPDEVKFSREWQRGKAVYDAAFRRLREFNRMFVKAYARELRAERREREGVRNARITQAAREAAQAMPQ
ncbi:MULTISPECIES: hypothetical protein [unclassified Xanthobacter]|uniref:hypothetical protein n=1 Tax=unclassified Xanthobacter TaxID=2623496 RepID=UPI001F1F87F7|nr:MULTISPECIES: hypothetical protein [unclassified Xanthobacter]